MLCNWEASGNQPLPRCTLHPGLTVTLFLQWHLWRSMWCGRMLKQLSISLSQILLPNKIFPNLMKKRNDSLSILESWAIINNLQFRLEIASTSVLGHSSPVCSVSFSGCPWESGCSSSNTLSALHSSPPPGFPVSFWSPHTSGISPLPFFSCFSH